MKAGEKMVSEELVEVEEARDEGEEERSEGGRVGGGEGRVGRRDERVDERENGRIGDLGMVRTLNWGETGRGPSERSSSCLSSS